MSYKNIIKSLFGDLYLEHAIAYNYSPSTRFELNNGGTYIEMFLESYERFKAILSFNYQEPVNFIVALCFYESSKLKRNLPENLKRLKRQEFNLPEKYERIETYSDDNESYTYTYLFELKLWSVEFKTIIWNVLGGDLAISPNSELKAYFFDIENQIAFHPYDDRGMDIIAKDNSNIEKLNNEFMNYKMNIR